VRFRTILPPGNEVRWRSYGAEGAAGGVIEYPLVRFTNGRLHLVTLREFDEELPGVGKCCVEQVPLRLAWAITTHKSQGMSLSCVRMNISNAFAAGQAYVALSRARSEDGLELTGKFDPFKVVADPIVSHFHMCIEAMHAVEASKAAGSAGAAGPRLHV
jgi:ATP-dependent DNA helicase PIF1